MTQLRCTVTNCLNNEQDLCCRHDIKIDGINATEKGGTCCQSFCERSGASATNSACNFKPTENTEIDCDVKNCIYNASCSCTASHIDVQSCGSACNCHDTLCSTFSEGETRAL